MYFVAVESIGQLQKDLEMAKESQRYAESHNEANNNSLFRSVDENKKLKEEKQEHIRQTGSLHTQLGQVTEENRRLKGGMFGK